MRRHKLVNDCYFHSRTREEIAQFASAGYPVIIPLAATEQHGPHLPVFTDSLICESIVNHAASRASEQTPMLVTPVFTVGCSDHHLQYNGTLSFSSATYLHMLNDIGESLVACGFHKIIFVNGHGGNERIMHQIASDFAVKHPVWTASASYWSIAAKALEDIQAREVGMVPGHAGGFETSLIMALRPEWVKRERISDLHVERPWLGAGIPGTFIGRHNELTGYDGYTDASHLATPEKGETYLNAIVGAVSDWLVQVSRQMSQSYEG
jgi:creatinine amidohydrolase